jgi:hypothetical protein
VGVDDDCEGGEGGGEVGWGEIVIGIGRGEVGWRDEIESVSFGLVIWMVWR